MTSSLIAGWLSALFDLVLEALTGAPTGNSISQCVHYTTLLARYLLPYCQLGQLKYLSKIIFKKEAVHYFRFSTFLRCLMSLNPLY